MPLTEESVRTMLDILSQLTFTLEQADSFLRCLASKQQLQSYLASLNPSEQQTEQQLKE